MEWIYGFMGRVAVLAVAGSVCAYALPKGSLSASGKRAISLVVLLYALEPVGWLFGG